MKITAMLGYKLFKELEDDTIDLIRIVKIRKNHAGSDPSEIIIKHEGSDSTEKVRVDSLKGYTPLEPDGLLTFNIVTIGTGDNICKDVMVTANKILNMKIGQMMPFVVCRQCITDQFNNLQITNEEDMMAGMSINQEDCPAGYDFRVMLACSKIDYSTSLNFYRTDTLDNLLELISTKKYDEVLKELFEEYILSNDLLMHMNKKSYKGWCKDLKTLLTQNNFQEDINQMLGITDINPIIKDHIITKQLPNNEEYSSLDDDMKLWLSGLFKINIADITVLEFGHDINLAEFNNARYLLLRDSSKKLYLTVYTLAGEYHMSDLEAEYEKKDFSEEFRINFYNKYNSNK